MTRIPRALVLALAVMSSPLLAWQSGSIDGATLEVEWYLTGGTFRELHTLHFSSTLEADCLALYGDRAVLIHHPGRFDLAYEIAGPVSALATAPLGSGLDAVLVSDSQGLHSITWQSGSGAFTSSALLATGPWASLADVWAFQWGAGVRVFGNDAAGSRLLVGEFDGSSLTELTPIPFTTQLRDLAAIDWTDADPGPELVWLFDQSLFVTDAAGAPSVWYPVTATDHMAVLESAGGEDVLAWVSTYTGYAFLYARSETTAYTPYYLGLEARADLVAIDRDGDGRDDVVLPSISDATATILQRGIDTFAPFTDGQTLILTETGSTTPQTQPVVVGAAGDFDNDGTCDLWLGQQGSTASQFVVRPEFEERFRPALPSPESLGLSPPVAGTRQLFLDLQNPMNRPAAEYHVQAFVVDWQTGILDPEPIADGFHPYDTGSEESELTVQLDVQDVPEVWALYVAIAQVNRVGSTVVTRHPTRLVYYSPISGIEEAIAAKGYPENTDPDDTGISTGARVGSRLGSQGTSGRPPP